MKLAPLYLATTENVAPGRFALIGMNGVTIFGLTMLRQNKTAGFLALKGHGPGQPALFDISSNQARVEFPDAYLSFQSRLEDLNFGPEPRDRLAGALILEDGNTYVGYRPNPDELAGLDVKTGERVPIDPQRIFWTTQWRLMTDDLQGGGSVIYESTAV